MAPDPAAAALDAAWLSGRRWFRHKGRRIESIDVEDSAFLGDGCELLVLAARLEGGEVVRYVVPTTGRGSDASEVADGDGAWRALVGWLTDGESQIPSTRGAFASHPAPPLRQLLPGGRGELASLAEACIGGEQSNSSVRLGDRLVLKLYRLVEPGINPEVEVCSFLSEAGFAHVPAVAGWIEYCPDDAPGAATAIVQEQVVARGDGWEWMLERLRDPSRRAAEALAGVAQLGGVTAEMHAALRSRPEASGFEAGPAGAEDLAAWHASSVQQLDGALAAVEGNAALRLGQLAPRLRKVLAAIGAADGAIRSRIHGDFHLGQLLATERGFVVIDFEGEPARTLAERRRPASPLRDVAGLLRSLDYAARTVEREDGGDLSAWLDDARSAFLAAYGESADAGLLHALEVEKACYEVRYEAANRPDWTWLPLAALERLAA
jgi:trehalose synthase-fused probable maltokinase